MKFAKLFSVTLAVLLFCGVLSAQTDRDRGLQLYKSGNFDVALDAFKKPLKPILEIFKAGAVSVLAI
jgi:hypothetical protein